MRLVEIEQAIEILRNALELGDAAERITKRINAREEEKAEIERQLAIERRKIKSFDFPRIHAFLEQMKSLNCAILSDLRKLATMFIHTIFYYYDYLIIINGGKGLVTAENIPLKSIENSSSTEIPGTFSGSSVCQPAPDHGLFPSPAGLWRRQIWNVIIGFRQLVVILNNVVISSKR